MADISHDYDGFKPTGSDARLVAEFYAELERELSAVPKDFPTIAPQEWVKYSRNPMNYGP